MADREGSCFQIVSEDLRCGLDPLGASVRRVRIRSRDGGWKDLALSPACFDPALPEPSLAGRTIGPCCGRIRGGEITLGTRRLSLARNEGNNHLHGGPGGCAFRLWNGTRVSGSHVRFETLLPDGLDGYPGNRRILAEWQVSGSTLSVRYTAETDRETFMDLTSHVYWDLSGRFDGSALDQELEIAAGRVVQNDGEHLPQAVAAAEDAFGFIRSRSIREMLSAFPDDPQILIGRGYNNAFLLDPALQPESGAAAVLYFPAGDVRMVLRTNAPALVLYTGGFLGGETRLCTPPGAASPGCAVALEAQEVPDAFHLPGFRPSVLRPGEVFVREISWSFTF